MTSDPRVTVAHVRAAKLCTRGARAWFSRRGLDWQTFLREGLPASALEATGDALAMRAVAEARRQEREP